MFSLESPHRGDSNEYTQYTIFNIKTRKSLFLNLQLWDFLNGLKNELETAVINEPSGFDPFKFHYKWRMSNPISCVTEVQCGATNK